MINTEAIMNRRKVLFIETSGLDTGCSILDTGHWILVAGELGALETQGSIFQYKRGDCKQENERKRQNLRGRSHRKRRNLGASAKEERSKPLKAVKTLKTFKT
jgi:hypothetical protein